jgi:hypothetical protein
MTAKARMTFIAVAEAKLSIMVQAICRRGDYWGS